LSQAWRIGGGKYAAGGLAGPAQGHGRHRTAMLILATGVNLASAGRLGQNLPLTSKTGPPSGPGHGWRKT